MLGGACMIGYALDAAWHAEIRRQLDARDVLYDEAPIIESVTAAWASRVQALPTAKIGRPCLAISDEAQAWRRGGVIADRRAAPTAGSGQ